MSNDKFSKPPLVTSPEQQKKLDAFLNEPVKRVVKKGPKKKPTKDLFFRVPLSLWEELQELMELTGLPMGALCTELLRPQIKLKLREVKQE